MASFLRTARAGIAPFAKSALFRSGAYAAMRSLIPSRDVAILRYHAICGEEGYTYADPGICVSPEGFEDHARHLAQNYAVLPLPEVVARLREGRDLPKNCVVVTFDDGYADNLNAARTLHRYGISGTFFITAGCMAGGDVFWPAEIRALVPAVSGESLELDGLGEKVRIPVRTDAERRSAIRVMNKLLKSSPIPTRERLREQLRRAAGTAAPQVMLGWDQIAEMHRLGMTIGAHTMTHPNLPSAGLPAATEEIVGAKARLESEIGVPVTMFSYPNGGAEQYYTPDLQRVVREAGYEAAATSRNAFAGRHSDLYALERIEVEESLEHLVFALEVERFLFRPRPRQSEAPRA